MSAPISILPALRDGVWRRPGRDDVPLVSHTLELGEGALAVTYGAPAAVVACEMSRHLGGQWWPGRGSVTWLNGRQATYILDFSRVPGVEEARKLAASLGAKTRSWTVGGVARSLLAWLGEKHPHTQSSERALGGLPPAYTYCAPGRYPGQSHVDLKAAYWQALCRLPSPVVTWLADGPCWHPLPPASKARWRDLLAGVAACKPIRVALNGCMLGSDGPPVCYHKGETLRVPPRPGHLQTAAKAVVRATYELCWLQREEAGACYANTDCVVMPAGQRPAVWDSVGYAYRIEAEGEADVCSLDVYKVGDKSTLWYDRGSRIAISAHASPPPPSLTYLSWH